MDGLIRLGQEVPPGEAISAEHLAASLRCLLQASTLLRLPETEAQLRLALLTLCAEAALRPRH